ncbi:MAG: hypothetical protein RLZZ303_3425 [Candidatus Hydrogenedentota bacterium]
MTFTEHLGELRDRIIYSGIALVAAFVVCYLFSDFLFYIIKHPLDPESQSEWMKKLIGSAGEGQESAQWVTLTPLEGFVVKFKLAGYFGLLFALPVILYQVCAFIFPGLKPTERRLVQYMVAGCSLLGTLGVVVAYFGVFPLVMPYLLQWTPEGVVTQLRMSETISIIIIGLVGFAVAFQFPIGVLVLVYMGVLTPKTLKEHRRIALVSMALASAILTPPDPFSMLIMLIPMAVLYEVSILVAMVVARRHPADETAA